MTNTRPATPKQMRLARKLAREANREAPPKGLSLPEASRLIDALKNVPRGWGLKADELGALRPLPYFQRDTEIVEEDDDGVAAAEAANERYFEERPATDDIPF